MKQWLSLSCISLLVGCSAQSISSPNTSKVTPTAAASDNIASTFYDYTIRSPQGEVLSVSALAAQFQDADIILVGEWHGHPAAHLLQAQLLAALYRQNSQLALSMEQFTRDKQGIINDYLANKIGEASLTKDANTWPNYISDYRPLIEFAKTNHLDVIAANAPKPIVRCIGKYGEAYLNRLPTNERTWVADSLTLTEDAYQDKFISSMHHGDEAQTKRQFAAQTAWDDTMAESMVDYLASHPNTQILHTAGRFHVEEGLGTASRILSRNPNLKVVMVTPVSSETVLKQGAPDYQVEMQPLPKQYMSKEKMIAAMTKIHSRNQSLQCYE
ncbi:ChaN family lipoprotein [Photobacterium kagoshimensis]|uniref:ChaN family lipoprotein n=1 Tax=Photobacterium kagoshimensis TaxID=2910242 RepID=UPI003D0C6C3E